MKKSKKKAAAYQRGREEMKAQIVAALEKALASDTGNDQHERGEACNQCLGWYQAIDVVEGCEA